MCMILQWIIIGITGIIGRIYILWSQLKPVEHHRNFHLAKNWSLLLVSIDWNCFFKLGILINHSTSNVRLESHLSIIVARLGFKFRFVVKLSVSSRTRGTIVNAMIYQRLYGGFTTLDRTGNRSQSAELVNPLTSFYAASAEVRRWWCPRAAIPSRLIDFHAFNYET